MSPELKLTVTLCGFTLGWIFAHVVIIRDLSRNIFRDLMPLIHGHSCIDNPHCSYMVKVIALPSVSVGWDQSHCDKGHYFVTIYCPRVFERCEGCSSATEFKCHLLTSRLKNNIKWLTVLIKVSGHQSREGKKKKAGLWSVTGSTFSSFAVPLFYFRCATKLLLQCSFFSPLAYCLLTWHTIYIHQSFSFRTLHHVV